MRTKLNDLHLVLLSTAAARDTGNLLPFPTSVSSEQARIAKAVAHLLRHKLIDEVPTTDHALRWRDDEGKSIGLIITDSGRAAIGAGEDEQTQIEPGAADADVCAEHSPSPSNKASLVVSLLQRDHGASIKDLTDATGWLPHTTRAALTGLRKKGHSVERFAHADGSRYRIQKTS